MKKRDNRSDILIAKENIENDEESYNSAVNLQWEKLAQAQTKEEIQEVLDTWPDRETFYTTHKYITMNGNIDHNNVERYNREKEK